MFTAKPHLTSRLHSVARQARSVATRLAKLTQARARREQELYARLGEVNRQLVDVQAARLALQAEVQHSRDERERLHSSDRQCIARLQTRVDALEAERDAAWQRVRELEASLTRAQSRQTHIKTHFEALRDGLERERSALQSALDAARAALTRSRREVEELRSHGSRLLGAMQQGQRLADRSGVAACEPDGHLERGARLQRQSEGGPAGAEQQTGGTSSLLIHTRDFLVSRRLRIAAGLPLLVGALAGATVVWDSEDRTRSRQAEGVQQGAGAGSATLTATASAPAQPEVEAEAGRVSAPVARQARAALAAMELQPTAASAGFDPGIQRQQRDLLTLGFDLGHSHADGLMGARTEQALREFETLYLPATGMQALADDDQLATLVNRVAERAREDAVRFDIGSEVLAALHLSSLRTGTELAYLAELAAVETRFDPTIRATRSSAAGLYQFTEDTWLQVVKRHGDKYGLGDYAAQIEYPAANSGSRRLLLRDPELRGQLLDLRLNPRLAALMAGEFAGDNRRKLASALARDINHTDLYFAHFLGVADAIAFLTLLQVMPEQPAGKLFPEAAGANGPIFYPPGAAPRTVAEVYALFERKFNTGRYEGWDAALQLADTSQ